MRQLVALTLPILCTQICQSGLSLVDTVMAGQVSARDLAGVAIGAGVWLPVFLLLVGILLSTTPLIGEVIGQNTLIKTNRCALSRSSRCGWHWC
ncbi:Multidrug-efflux transporter [Moraxella atlantae]|uniref:Multidrug-efflux transporter n=2 Tax=Faucicola atlantae TaxID=34059 RepID=A0A378QLK1_9GAMM|nr:Multidrug-efflux transporter [Moraxella atlantae]